MYFYKDVWKEIFAMFIRISVPVVYLGTLHCSTSASFLVFIDSISIKQIYIKKEMAIKV